MTASPHDQLCRVQARPRNFRCIRASTDESTVAPLTSAWWSVCHLFKHTKAALMQQPASKRRMSHRHNDHDGMRLPLPFRPVTLASGSPIVCPRCDGHSTHLVAQISMQTLHLSAGCIAVAVSLVRPPTPLLIRTHCCAYDLRHDPLWTAANSIVLHEASRLRLHLQNAFWLLPRSSRNNSALDLLQSTAVVSPPLHQRTLDVP